MTATAAAPITPLRRMLSIVACFAALFLAIFMTAILVRLTRTDRCPVGSFLSRVSVDSTVLMAIPLAVALIGLAALVTNTLPTGPAIFGSTRRNAIIGTLVAAALFPGSLYVGIGNELCLSWSSIKMRDNTLSPVRKYVWSDVMELHTVCSMHGSRRGRHQAVGARFLLADGDSFWLSVIEYGHVFDALSRVLRGTKFKFDDSDMDETCSPENHALFSRLP